MTLDGPRFQASSEAGSVPDIERRHGEGRPGTSPIEPVYERVFGTELLVSFSAATVEEAEQRVQDIVTAVLALEAVWEVEANFNPDQKAETVDA